MILGFQALISDVTLLYGCFRAWSLLIICLSGELCRDLELKKSSSTDS